MIPVHEPYLDQDDEAAVLAALRRGEISGTFSQDIPAFEQAFAEYLGVRHAVAVSSGTTALQLAVAAAGIGPGDEVLVSSLTNIATALAPAHQGALPVPVDSEPRTWNLDLDRLEAMITPRTRAIIPVHIYGHPVDMDRLMDIAGRHNLLVIEDCAEAHGAEVRGRRAGSFGQISCFSFYANKIITSGEGGMVVTDDPELAGRCRLLRNLAFTTPRFWHRELGFNFRMTGLQAALGLSQFRKLERFVAAKRSMAALYNEALGDIPGLGLPVEEDYAKNVYWMYGVVIRPEFGLTRDQVATSLRQAGVDTRTFFCPMNLQPCLRELPGFRPEPCPVAESLWEQGLYLPSSFTIGEPEIATVAAALRDIQAG